MTPIATLTVDDADDDVSVSGIPQHRPLRFCCRPCTDTEVLYFFGSRLSYAAKKLVLLKCNLCDCVCLCVLNENLSTSCLLLLLLHHYVLSGGCESIQKGLALYKEQREAGFNQNCERMCGTKKKENQPLALKCRLA